MGLGTKCCAKQGEMGKRLLLPYVPRGMKRGKGKGFRNKPNLTLSLEPDET